ncbi:MAG: hypothetical protein HDS35_00325 [Bacteroides sp.]|nr:hypothetical protein [Bacteroides sp.]
METTNKITNDGRNLRVTLDVYLFMEDEVYIAYAPSLDLSGYGQTEDEAMKSFSIVLEEYITYGLSNRTLVKDLRAHGWKVKSFKQRKLSAPSFETLIQNNEMFHDILTTKDYRKVSEPFPISAPA